MSRRKRRSPTRRVFSGDKLRQARENAELRREDVAARAQCGFNSVYLYESGRSNPTANVLGRLADALGITVDDLYDKVESP